mmetsp:Transcript_13784/g.40994  ORF Transcript_13784/g.40994 Transcript_13784/m.40994 type:complete len:218 (+) Transcript_13784:2-655(+)
MSCNLTRAKHRRPTPMTETHAAKNPKLPTTTLSTAMQRIGVIVSQKNSRARRRRTSFRRWPASTARAGNFCAGDEAQDDAAGLARILQRSVVPTSFDKDRFRLGHELAENVSMLVKRCVQLTRRKQNRHGQIFELQAVLVIDGHEQCQHIHTSRILPLAESRALEQILHLLGHVGLAEGNQGLHVLLLGTSAQVLDHSFKSSSQLAWPPEGALPAQE